MSFLGKIRSATAGMFLGASAALGWGGPYSEATAWSGDRSNVMYLAPADTRQALPRWTRTQINAKVDWLFQNFGIVKEGVRGIARHTVARGRSLQINSDDEVFNELAELDWEMYAQSKDRCDLAGRRTFYEFQNLAVEQRIKAGEFLAAFCQNPRWKSTDAQGNPLLDEGEEIGDPCLCAFAANEIQNPPDKEPSDRVYDGVELDENNAPTFYHKLGANGAWQAIPASEMVHWFKPDEVNAVRSVSELAQSVARLVDIHDLIKVTTKSGKLHGAVALMVKKAVKMGGQGAIGAIKTSGATPAPASAPSPGNAGGAVQVAGPPLEQVFGGGAIMYVNDENDIKLAESAQPSPLVEPFVTDLLMRDCMAGWGVPAEFFWAPGKLTGSNVRAVLGKADLLFTVLGDGVDCELGLPWVTRYLLHRIATGKLQAPTDPNWLLKMAFQAPPKLNVDEGRTGTLEVLQLANGITTMQIIDDSRGRIWRPKIKQWFREWAFAAKCAKEEKVPWALRFWRAAQPGAGGGPADNPNDPTGDAKPPGADDGDDKEEKGKS